MYAVQGTGRRCQGYRGVSKVMFECLSLPSASTDKNLSIRLVDGEWTDDDIKDPLSQMFDLLVEKRDKTLTQRWGLWITKRDPEKGLKVTFICVHF